MTAAQRRGRPRRAFLDRTHDNQRGLQGPLFDDLRSEQRAPGERLSSPSTGTAEPGVE
jgi:hypothetical protein